MKVLLSVSNNLSIEVESDKITDIFEELSIGQEVFGHECCGVCGCTKIRYLVRQNDNEDKFYEVTCTDYKCRARLSMGAKKRPVGALYPKRKWDALSPGEQKNRSHQESECKNGYLPHNGWYVFKRSEEPAEQKPKSERPF